MAGILLDFICIGALIAADQAIKAWATAVLAPVSAMPLIPNIIELRYVLNDGMAFSMLSGKQTLLIGATACFLLLALWYLIAKCRTSRFARCSWVLIIAGGCGNLIDRVLNHQVVDYINVLFMRFAVFNFADICVCVGVGLLILQMLFDDGNADKPQEKA